jgi:hypothetical protein
MDNAVEGYIFDQQLLLPGENNILTMETKLWHYIQKNTIDIVVIRGFKAPLKKKSLNLLLQDNIGRRQLHYVLRPEVDISLGH